MVEPFYTCNTMYCKEEGRASVFLVVDWNLYLHRGACKFMMTSAAPAPLTLSAAKRGLCFSSVGTVVRSAESSCNEVRHIANFSMHFSWNDGGGSRRPCPVACIAVLAHPDGSFRSEARSRCVAEARPDASLGSWTEGETSRTNAARLYKLWCGGPSNTLIFFWRCVGFLTPFLECVHSSRTWMPPERAGEEVGEVRRAKCSRIWRRIVLRFLDCM